MHVYSLLRQPIEGQRGLVDGGQERVNSPVEGGSLEYDNDEEAGPPPSLREPVVAHTEGKAVQQVLSTM